MHHQSPPSSIIIMSPLPFLLLLSFAALTAAAAATPPSSLPLILHSHSPPLPPTPSSHPLRPLSLSSLLRATSLKHTTPQLPSVSALFPHSYGGYSLPLSLGNPPRSFPFLLDTASHLSSLPCSRSFSCLHCPPVTSSPPPLYLPTSSLTSRLLPCRSSACHSLHPSHSCSPSNPNSTLCPPFLLFYGSGSSSGSTGGLLMLDHLQLPGRLLPDFVFVCSLFSDRQPPAGLAAFGRGPVSLPSQLGIPSFAYCLVSRKFDDDSSVAGSLFLGGALSDDVEHLQFIPFLQNPTKSPPFSVYYYLPLRQITVNGKPVKLPASALTAGPNGDGGTILDTGTTFTYMEPSSFNAVVAMLTRAMNTRYNRSSLLESRTGLKPCFILPSTSPQVELPELVFEFVGGAEMRLPVENYFVATDARAVCLAVVTDVGAAGRAATAGPSIVIGSFQQQNYYMVYDLARGRLGFRRQNCVRH